VTWLAWSPPGLAKHKRSVLAVLTSNHVLSLWASNSDMAVPESWERVCFVNNAVIAALREEKFKSRFKSASSPRLRRIRSAAWAPMRDLVRYDDGGYMIAKESLERHGAHSDRVNGVRSDLDGAGVENYLSLPTIQQLLAVANDCGSIYILKVCSPSTNTFNAWEAAVVEMYLLPTHGHIKENTPQILAANGTVFHKLIEHQDVEQPKNPEALNASPSLLAAAFDKVNFIDGVSWSPWIRDFRNVTDQNELTITHNGVLSQLNFQTRLKQDSIWCYCSDLMTRKQDILEPAQRSTLWFHRVQLPSP